MVIPTVEPTSFLLSIRTTVRASLATAVVHDLLDSNSEPRFHRRTNVFGSGFLEYVVVADITLGCIEIFLAAPSIGFIETETLFHCSKSIDNVRMSQ